MADAPQGTVSFLFTDIVGSTRLWEKFPNHMGAALARHDELVRQAAEIHGGYVFKTVGDAFCVAFQTPRHALLAAIDAQRALAGENWEMIGVLIVRMGLHTGLAEYRQNDYFGGTLNRAARIEAAAHGGQILLSQTSVDLLEDEDIDGISFKSLGSHRLRNLDRPEHLFQAVAPGLEISFPPPKSMEVLPNNLPVQTTSFIGRDAEVKEVRAILQKASLVTLTGTGGTGKTRLALEVGALVIDSFSDGVWLVELATVEDPATIVAVISGVLGVREEPERPLRDTLVNFLRGKTILIILDNCEHLLQAVSALVAEFLRSCPQLRILATSRHSLGIPGETTFAVAPLGVLDVRVNDLSEFSPNELIEKILQFDAVKLFVERATAVQPDFQVTEENAAALAEIASRLDGIPLAIELAAVRVRVLDLTQIAARLDDRFRLLRGGDRTGLPRQQTLQALIDWSYDLLSEPERILFRRMGVFAGGRTLDALEAICSGQGVEEFDILDLVQQLADKSLVSVEREVTGELRYTISESVWQYARQKLEESGENDALRQRHLEYFLSWAEMAAPRLEGPDQKIWLDRVLRELFNMRLALEWAVQSGQPEAGLRCVTALYRAVEVRGNVLAALDMIKKLLALPGSVRPEYRAAACVAASRFAWAMDRYDEAREFQTEARGIYDSIGDEAGSGLVDMLTAFLDRGDGDLEAAEKRFVRGLEIGRRKGSLFLVAGCRSGLGSIALDHGDVAEALRLKEESLADYEKIGDHWIIGLILWGIARVAIARKDLTLARSSLKKWLHITRQLGNRWILVYILDCYGEVALLDGQPATASRLLGAAEGLRAHLGTRLSSSEQTEHDAVLVRLTEALPKEEWGPIWEEGRQISSIDTLATFMEEV